MGTELAKAFSELVKLDFKVSYHKGGQTLEFTYNDEIFGYIHYLKNNKDENKYLIQIFKERKNKKKEFNKEENVSDNVYICNLYKASHCGEHLVKIIKKKCESLESIDVLLFDKNKIIK